MVTIGEYLALMDSQRKGCPLTQMLLRGKVKEESLSVLPVPYAFVRPLMRPIMPMMIGNPIVGVDVASSEDYTVVTGRKDGQIFYLDEVNPSGT